MLMSMRIAIPVRLVLAGILCMVTGPANGAIPTSERIALQYIDMELDGQNWTDRTGWGGSAGTECTWYGITCDTAGDHVIALELDFNNLSGEIPEEIEDLTELQTLDLSANDITGPIPAELGTLSALEVLDLSANDLTGAIPPELGGLPALRTLWLNGNGLTGPIPSELGGLASLQSLRLDKNNLSGPIPGELGDLSNLESLSLSLNSLSGPIPRELGNIGTLTSLRLGGNLLSGPIPPELGDLSALTKLDVSGNELTGAIPAELGQLTALEELSLGMNHLSGTIPAVLGGLTNLETLYLRSNRLEGPIPSELGTLTNLRYLYLDRNKLSGDIPSELTNLTALVDGSGLGIARNAVHTSDSTVADFVDLKAGASWRDTQTLPPPPGVTVGDTTACSAVVSWNPVDFTDPGGYRLEFMWAGQPWRMSEIVVPDKAVTTLELTNLRSGEACYIRVRSYTLPNLYNQNLVLSDPSSLTIAHIGSSGGLLDGDVDGNSVTDTVDLEALLDYLFVPAPAHRPDVDCDGLANAVDILELIGMLW